jgi:omega-hydroxy-beta-dihydromenaquinone-9 sulfotransferase
VTYRKPGRLVLKSPLHTARIAILHELFPQAKFVSIVRNPYEVIPSMMNIFRVLYASMALQQATGADLEDLTFHIYQRLSRRQEEGRRLLSPGQFHELRYEALVHDSVDTLRTLYEQLDLGSFAELEPALKRYLAGLSHYHAGHHQLSPALEARIREQCGDIIRRYCYAPGPSRETATA